MEQCRGHDFSAGRKRLRKKGRTWNVLKVREDFQCLSETIINTAATMTQVDSMPYKASMAEEWILIAA